MATISRTDVAKHKPVYEYTLVLNQAEAEALQAVLGFVGGDPDVSPRRHIDNVAKALKAFGIQHNGTWADRCIRRRTLPGYIYFNNAPEQYLGEHYGEGL